MKLLKLLGGRSAPRWQAADGATENHDTPETDPVPIIDAETRRRYVAECAGRIEGWNEAGAFRFADSIDNLQKNRLGISGGLAEIGIHHGQFFVYLAMLRARGEKALACDVFERQELNKDGSGCGDRAIFEQNLREYLGSLAGIVVFADSSERLDKRIIESAVGKVRLISIDGGHWREIVINDLCAAASVLHENGVAVLDDILNPYWVGVSEGLACYLWDAYDRGRINSRLPAKKKLVPFAVGGNKALLCFEDKYQQWIELFEEFGPSEALTEKPLGWQGRPILLYENFIAPRLEA
jgi:hypothetical protein